MQKYNLIEIKQFETTFYALVADPRIVVKMLSKHEANQVQEAQRPWSEKRVKDIAQYVCGKSESESKGLIPNAPIINIKEKLEIKKEGDELYVMLPSTETEFAEYENCIEAIDGQHRIRAFMEEYRDPDFKDDSKYLMLFSLFDKLSTSEKKSLFMITNEKQEKVPNNLLRLFRRDLGLLKQDEEVFDLVYLLNSEDFSPLKSRIMIGADKIKKGYQESQISKILNDSSVFEKLKSACSGDKEKMAKMLSRYFKAWENVYSHSFKDPNGETMTKISGIRYIIYILPYFMTIMRKNRKQFDVAEIEKLIKMIKESGVPDPFGACDTEQEKASLSLNFRNGSGTIHFANEAGESLTTYEGRLTDNYDFTEGL